MLKILKNLFGGSASASEPEQLPAIDYNGYHIVPTPREESGGWSTEAQISREIDGETRTHHFIRADKSNSRDAAVEMISNKCRMAIDQLGDNIFR